MPSSPLTLQSCPSHCGIGQSVQFPGINSRTTLIPSETFAKVRANAISSPFRLNSSPINDLSDPSGTRTIVIIGSFNKLIVLTIEKVGDSPVMVRMINASTRLGGSCLVS